MSLEEYEKKLEGYRDELEQLRGKAKIALTVNECLEVHDRVQQILDNDLDDGGTVVDRLIVYRQANEVYKSLVGSLAQFGKEGEGLRKSLWYVSGHPKI